MIDAFLASSLGALGQRLEIHSRYKWGGWGREGGKGGGGRGGSKREGGRASCAGLWLPPQKRGTNMQIIFLSTAHLEATNDEVKHAIHAFVRMTIGDAESFADVKE